MQRVDLSKPGEKKKLIGAAVLGVVAIGFLYWVLIGFDSGAPATTARTQPSPTPQTRTTQTGTRPKDASQEIVDLGSVHCRLSTSHLHTMLPKRGVIYLLTTCRLLPLKKR